MKLILKLSVVLAAILALFVAVCSCETDTCNATDGKLLNGYGYNKMIDSEDACCNYAYDNGYKYYCYKNGECYGYLK